MITDPRRFLEDLVRERKLTLKSVSLAIGRNPAYLQQYLKCHVPKELPYRTAYALSLYFNIPVNLFYGVTVSWGGLSDSERRFILAFRALTSGQKKRFLRQLEKYGV